jgi:hypothetical protein
MIINIFDNDAGENCRFLYLVGQLRAGGSERQLYYLLSRLDRDCYQPAIVVWNFRKADAYSDKILALEMPLYVFPTNTSGVRKMIAFRYLVQKIKPAIIHSYSFYTNFAAFWGAVGTNSIAVGSVRSDFSWALDDAGVWFGRLNARWPRS